MNCLNILFCDGIRQSTSAVDWRYVPTDSNPADYATRGLKPDAIEQLWTQPSPFLTQSPHQWPHRRHLPRACSICATVKTEPQSAVLNFKRFSFWFRLLRSSAQVCRFVRLLRNRSSVRSLATDDYQPDRHLLFRQSQFESFPTTVSQLHSKKPFVGRQAFTTQSRFGRTRRSPFRRSPPVRFSTLLDTHSDRFRHPQVHLTTLSRPLSSRWSRLRKSVSETAFSDFRSPFCGADSFTDASLVAVSARKT